VNDGSGRVRSRSSEPCRGSGRWGDRGRIRKLRCRGSSRGWHSNLGRRRLWKGLGSSRGGLGCGRSWVRAWRWSYRCLWGWAMRRNGQVQGEVTCFCRNLMECQHRGLIPGCLRWFASLIAAVAVGDAVLVARAITSRPILAQAISTVSTSIERSIIRGPCRSFARWLPVYCRGFGPALNVRQGEISGCLGLSVSFLRQNAEKDYVVPRGLEL
jgi:hypothetical protein